MCISGYAEEAMRAQLAQHKNIAFLAKPFSLKQLAMVVKDALARERVG